MADFASAIGNGSAVHVVGKPFTTTDTGFLSSTTGTGLGTGITLVSASSIANAMFAELNGVFGQSGPDLQNFCDAVGAACATLMGQATLTSTPHPAPPYFIYSGSGAVDVGSVGVVAAPWATSIQSLGTVFLGTAWPQICTAIGNACTNNIKSVGTGSVTITGSYSQPPPIPPTPPNSSTPGSGTGTGTIS